MDRNMIYDDSTGQMIDASEYLSDEHLMDMMSRRTPTFMPAWDKSQYGTTTDHGLSSVALDDLQEHGDIDDRWSVDCYQGKLHATRYFLTPMTLYEVIYDYELGGLNELNPFAWDHVIGIVGYSQRMSERMMGIKDSASRVCTIRADGSSSYKVTITELVRELGLDVGDQVRITITKI